MASNGKNGHNSHNGHNGHNGVVAAKNRPLEVRAVEAPDLIEYAGDTNMPPEKAKAILRERARALAKATTVELDETRQLVVFCLANETYGISADYVREVKPVTNLSPVPCTPSFVMGVINIRGSIYSVIDIREFFGVPKREITDSTKVILVSAAGLEVGILADDVKKAMNVPIREIKTSLSSHVGVKEEYVEGVTKDMLIILNVEAVLSDERIIVNEEVM